MHNLDGLGEGGLEQTRLHHLTLFVGLVSLLHVLYLFRLKRRQSVQVCYGFQGH